MSTVTPIDQLTYSLPQAGRIRTGEQYKTPSGKMAPCTIDHFRFTSSDETLIEWCAQQYGGIVTRFESQGSGDKWKVDSDRAEIDVIVAVPGSYTLSYEKRGGSGALERSCNGRTCDVLTFTPDDAGWRTVDCICREKGLDDWTRECAKQLRMPVKLPGCPTIGTWRWDSTSENSIRDIRGVFEEIALLAGRGRHHCKMRLEARTSKGFDRSGKPVTQRYTVVVLDPGVSVESLVAGDSRLVQLPTPSVTPATGALEAGPPTVTPSQAGEPAGTDGVGGDQHPPSDAPPTPSSTDDEIVDAEIVDEGIDPHLIASWLEHVANRKQGTLLIRARQIARELGEPEPMNFSGIAECPAVAWALMKEAGNDEHARATTDR